MKGEGIPSPFSPFKEEITMATKKTETVNETAPIETAAETGPKMVKVRILRTKVDQEDVFVSVNLRTYMIKRGVEVEVPDFVAEVLRHQEEMLEEIMLFEEKNRRN